MSVVSRLNAYERLMRLDKPIGILLLLWPTLWGIWASSGGAPSLFLLWIFVLGTVLMRSAGCIVNDWADRRFDGYVERTKDRPLVTGEVSPLEALLIAAALSLCAFLLIIPLHELVWKLSVAALLLAAIYPFTKRFLPLPQAWLGIAFGFGIPMAFAAHQYAVPTVAWMMLAANVFWCIAYDTEYAMVDRDDDVKIGIRSSAILFGRFDVPVVMLCYALALVLLGVAGMQLGRGPFFYGGLLVAAGIAGWHYTLIRDRSREGCFRAFRHNNWFGAAIFVGMLFDYRLHNTIPLTQSIQGF